MNRPNVSNKPIAVLICLFAALCFPFAITAEDLVEGVGQAVPAMIIGSPDSITTKATSGEKGLMQAMVLMYTSTRNAVRDAYDEVMYWEGMKEAYKKIDKWFEANKVEYDVLDINNRQISVKKEHLWNRLIKMEAMFDGMDSTIFLEARKFDRALSSIKDKRDSVTLKLDNNIKLSGAPGVSYRVALRPYSSIDTSTMTISEAMDSVAGKVDEFYLTTAGIDKKIKNEHTPADVKKRMKAARDSVPDALLFDMTKMQIASSMARSEYYYAWSIKAMENIDTLEKKFSDYKSISQIDAQTAWYRLESATAKNVKIRHSIEELKLYIASLGLDVNRKTQVRADALFSARLSGAIRDTINNRR